MTVTRPLLVLPFVHYRHSSMKSGRGMHSEHCRGCVRSNYGHMDPEHVWVDWEGLRKCLQPIVEMLTARWEEALRNVVALHFYWASVQVGPARHRAYKRARDVRRWHAKQEIRRMRDTR